MRKNVKRCADKNCTEKGIVCKELQHPTQELELALHKMRELHREAQEYAYGYMAAFGGIDVEECAVELKTKVEQLRTVLADTCYKCKGYSKHIAGIMIEAEMFVARQAFADAEARYEEVVGPEKYAEMFYE